LEIADTPTWNIIVVTTGIAWRCFQDGDILPQDTLIVDEIHQTSAELELCLALGKRVGCQVDAFDPENAAMVGYLCHVG